MTKRANNGGVPEITAREVLLETPFIRVVGKRVDGQLEGQPYYSLELLDYVTVVATTVDDSVVLVRQFRPAVEAGSLGRSPGPAEAGATPRPGRPAQALAG